MVEVHIFDRVTLSVFSMREFTSKENLNIQKQIIILNFRLWLTKKAKIWVVVPEEVFIQESVVGLKLWVFGFKNCFPYMLVVTVSLHLLLLACDIQSIPHFWFNSNTSLTSQHIMASEFDSSNSQNPNSNPPKPSSH